MLTIKLKIHKLFSTVKWGYFDNFLMFYYNYFFISWITYL